MNEDCWLAGRAVFAVADGMGGHASGDVASHLALAALQPLADRSRVTVDDVVQAVESGNAAILDAVRTDPRRFGMGTTIAGLTLVEMGGVDHWLVFHLGDSRVYRLMDGALSALSVDHSHVQELVDAHRITAQQARTHPQRNVLTRSLGTSPGMRPELVVLPAATGERFLICTDGLNEELSDVRLGQVMTEEPDCRAAADRLVAEAVAAGGRDNVTALVVTPTADSVLAAGVTAPRRRYLDHGKVQG